MTIKKTHLVLSIIFFILLYVPISPQHFLIDIDIKLPQSSYTITNNSIYIDNNNESTSFDRGSGNIGDPYILENKTINISNNEYGLKIYNVDYVTIQNCTFVAEIALTAQSYGIHISGCNYVTLYNNTITDITSSETINGIYIDGTCTSINITRNSIENLLSPSIIYGIRMRSGVSNGFIMENILQYMQSGTIYGINTQSGATIHHNNLHHLNGTAIRGIYLSSIHSGSIRYNNMSRMNSESSIQCICNDSSDGITISNNNIVMLSELFDESSVYREDNNVITPDLDEILNMKYEKVQELTGAYEKYLFNMTYNYTQYLSDPTYRFYLVNYDTDEVVFEQSESLNGTSEGYIEMNVSMSVGNYYGYYMINETDTMSFIQRVPISEYIEVENLAPIVTLSLSEDKLHIVVEIVDSTFNDSYYVFIINSIEIDNVACVGDTEIIIPIDNSKAGLYFCYVEFFDGYGASDGDSLNFAIHENGGLPDTENLNYDTTPPFDKFMTWLFTNPIWLLCILVVIAAIISLIIWIIKRHRKNAEKEGHYTCAECGDKFSSIKALDKHLISKHKYPKDYSSANEPKMN